MEKTPIRFFIGGAILTALVIWMVHAFSPAPRVETITYSQFKSLVNEALVTDLVIDQKTIRGEIKVEGLKRLFSEDKRNQKSEGDKPHRFVAVRVEDPGLTADLEKAGISFRGEVVSHWLSNIFSWVVPVMLLFLFWIVLLKGAQNDLRKATEIARTW